MKRLALLVVLVIVVGGGGRSLLRTLHDSAGPAAARVQGALNATAESRRSSGTARTTGCRHARHVTVTFSRAKYPHIIAHIKRSWAKGYPHVQRINRRGASERRHRLLAGIPTRHGFGLDEEPAAVLRSTVRADVAYVPSHENRSAGSRLGSQIGSWCEGTRVIYRFTS